MGFFGSSTKPERTISAEEHLRNCKDAEKMQRRERLQAEKVIRDERDALLRRAANKDSLLSKNPSLKLGRPGETCKTYGKVCGFYKSGHCMFGDKCKNLHIK